MTSIIVTAEVEVGMAVIMEKDIQYNTRYPLYSALKEVTTKSQEFSGFMSLAVLAHVDIGAMFSAAYKTRTPQENNMAWLVRIK